MKSGKEADRYHTLTGGVEAALTTKELFLEDTNGDWVGLAPSTFLAVSTEEVRDDDTSACAAISPPFPCPSSSSSSSFSFCVFVCACPYYHTSMTLIDCSSRLE